MSEDTNEPQKPKYSLSEKIGLIVLAGLFGFGLIQALISLALTNLPHMSFLPSSVYEMYVKPTPTPTLIPTPTLTPAAGRIFPCPLGFALNQAIELDAYLALHTGYYSSGSTTYRIWLTDTLTQESSGAPGDNPHIIYANLPNRQTSGMQIVKENKAYLYDQQGSVIPWAVDMEGKEVFITFQKIHVRGLVVDQCVIDIHSLSR